MRVLKLQMEGFTCYQKPVEIDFSNLELFAITGATGSGKSSIIDAVTFSLYGKVPRVATDVNSLISQGYNRMNVLLEFVIGEQKYKVARRMQQKRGSQAILDQEINDSWEGVASGIRQVNQKIIEIIGLDYESFIRCIILPQGDFQKLLQDAKGRQDILTRLLNLEILGNMQKLASKKLDQLQQKEKQIEIRLETEFSHTQVETLEEQQERYQNLQKEIERYEEELKTWQVRQKELFEIISLQENIQQSKQQYDKLLPQHKQNLQLREKIDAAKDVLPLLPRMEMLSSSQQKHHRFIQEQEKLEFKIKNTQENFDQAQEEVEKTEKELEKLPELEKEKQKLQKMIHLQNQLEKQQQEHQEREKNYRRDKNRKMQAEKKLEQICKQKESSEKDFQEISSALEEHKTSLDKLHRFWKMKHFGPILEESLENCHKREKTAFSKKKLMEEKEADAQKANKKHEQCQEQTEKIQKEMAAAGVKETLQNKHHQWEQAHRLHKQGEELKNEIEKREEKWEKNEEALRELNEEKKKTLQKEKELLKAKKQIESKEEKKKTLQKEIAPLFEILQQKEKNLQENQEKQESLREKEKKNEQELSKIQTKFQQAQKKRDKQIIVFEKDKSLWLEAYTKNLAHSLQAHLKKGEDCPVCQQKVKKVPSTSPQKEKPVQELKQKLEASEQKLSEFKQELTQYESQARTQEQIISEFQKESKEREQEITVQEKEIEKLTKELDILLPGRGKTTSRVEKLQREIEEIPKAKEIISQDLSEKQRLVHEQNIEEKNLQERQSEQKAELSKQKESHQKISDEIKTLTGEEHFSEKELILVQQQIQKVEKLEKELQKIEKELIEYKLDKEISEQKNENAQQEWKAAHQEHQEIKEAWQEKRCQLREKLELKVENIEAALEKGVEQYEKVQQEQEYLEKKHQERANEIQKLELEQIQEKSTKKEIDHSLKEQEKKVKTLQLENQDLATEIFSVTRGENPQLIASRVEQKKKNIQEEHHRIREKYLVLEESLKGQNEDLKKQKRESNRLLIEIEETQAELSREIEERGYQSFSEIEKVKASPTTIAKWEESVSQSHQQLQELEARLHYLEEQLQGRQAKRHDLQRLEGQILLRQKDIAKKTEDRGALRTMIHTLEKNLQEVDKIQKEYKRVCQEGAIIKQLSLDLRANRFPTFVLDQALQTLAEDGSIQFELLSSGRYAFTIEKREFCVIDRWNNDEIRPSKTLSGGETFLASLSLAIALAERIYQLGHRMGSNCALESLFLDEGFGSLDEEHLDIVVKALNNLQGTGRTIGIISHLTALNNYLPVRIVVEKNREGAQIHREGML